MMATPFNISKSINKYIFLFKVVKMFFKCETNMDANIVSTFFSIFLLQQNQNNKAEKTQTNNIKT